MRPMRRWPVLLFSSSCLLLSNVNSDILSQWLCGRPGVVVEFTQQFPCLARDIGIRQPKKKPPEGGLAERQRPQGRSRSEAVTDTDVEAAGVLAASGRCRGAAQGVGGLAVVVDLRVRGVDRSALGQAVDVANSEQLGVIHRLRSQASRVVRLGIGEGRLQRTLTQGPGDGRGDGIDLGITRLGLHDQQRGLDAAEIVGAAEARHLVRRTDAADRVGEGHMDRTVLVAEANIFQLVGASAFTGSQVGRAVEAAQAGGGLIGDHIVGAGESARASAQRVVEHLGDVAQTGGRVGIKVFDVQAGDRLVAAQADFTEITGQADRHATVPETVGIGGAAGVGVEARLQPEAGLQATAEVFRTLHAETAVAQAAGVQLFDIGVAGLDVLQVGIDDAEQGDRGLRDGSAAGQAEDGQCNQSFFHSILLGVHPSRRPRAARRLTS
mmetsp:Transcript_9617/g.22295  ORF Transcript_9617/g.22295 Transcript_9617/m.22295 type:complete len:438 (-) Transcript_9617:3324-4637(-)